MTSKLYQSKQEAGARNPKRVHSWTSLFQQAREQFPWFVFTAFAMALTALFLTTCVEPASAPDVFVGISGTVTDTQGPRIPDADITITNEQTRISRSLKTDSHG